VPSFLTLLGFRRVTLKTNVEPLLALPSELEELRFVTVKLKSESDAVYPT